MCDGATHRMTAGLGVGVSFAIHELYEKGELPLKPIIAGGLARKLGTLPDIVF